MVRSKLSVRFFRLQIVFLAIAMVAANAVCVARCLGMPCHGATESRAEVPPCHRSESKAPVDPCKQSVFVAFSDQISLARHTAEGSVFGTTLLEGPHLMSLPEMKQQAASLGASPPSFPQLRFSVVFRI